MDVTTARSRARRITGSEGYDPTTEEGRAKRAAALNGNGADHEESEVRTPRARRSYREAVASTPAEVEEAIEKVTGRKPRKPSEVEVKVRSPKPRAPKPTQAIKKGTSGTFAVTIVLPKEFERYLTNAGWNAEDKGHYVRSPMQGVAHTYVRQFVERHCQELKAKAKGR